MKMDAKKHYSKILKEENARLLSDIRKIVEGDVYLLSAYKAKFKIERDVESMVWMGLSSYKEKRLS